MSWGISPNATEKEKIFADFNDSLNGMNCADGLSYYHYSKIYDIGRELADKEYEQGRADRDREIAESNVFFSNRPIEDIVLETVDSERERIIKALESQKATEEDDSIAESISTAIWNKAISRAISIVKRGEENE